MATETTRLWNAWRARCDESAFEKLVRPELPATYHLAQRLGLGRADAEDVVQDALLQLAQVRTDVPGRVGVGAWLMRTVRFQSLTRRRTDRRRRKHETAETRRRPSSDGCTFDVREEVERALGQLDEADRQILMFRFLYDLDYREIAYVLGISENACRIRVHRASEHMRGRIGRKAPALLAAIPLPAFPNAAQSIAVATMGGTSTVAGAGLLGGLIVSTGMKMAVSAVAAALVTAGGFVALREQPRDPSSIEASIEASATPGEERDASLGGTGLAPTLEAVSLPADGYAQGTGVLLDRPGLGGKIVFADGLEGHDVRVYAAPFEGRERPAIEGMMAWRTTMRTALRGRYDARTRRYSFRDIAPGRYLVCVTMDGRKVLASAEVEVRDRLVEQEIELGVVDTEGYVPFRVIGPDGKPLDAGRTSFMTSFDGPKHSIGGGGEALARNDGTWLVKHSSMTPSPGTQPEGVYHVRVSHPAYGERVIEHDPTDTREILVRFAAPAKLVVTLSGLPEGLAGGVTLKKYISADGMSLDGMSSVRAGDAFTLTHVQPETWHLVYYVMDASGDGAHHMVQVDLRTVELRGGENPIQWALPPLYTVRIEAADMEAKPRLGLRRLGVPVGSAYMHQFSHWDEESGASFCRFVPPGRYELTGNYGGRPYHREINVPKEMVIRLD